MKEVLQHYMWEQYVNIAAVTQPSSILLPHVSLPHVANVLHNGWPSFSSFKCKTQYYKTPFCVTNILVTDKCAQRYFSASLFCAATEVPDLYLHFDYHRSAATALGSSLQFKMCLNRRKPLPQSVILVQTIRDHIKTQICIFLLYNAGSSNGFNKVFLWWQHIHFSIFTQLNHLYETIF